MTRWLSATLSTCCLLGIMTGCGQPVFLSKEVYCNAHNELLPPQAEHDPNVVNQPLSGPEPAPPNIDTPDRKERFITLQEALAICLENGTPGSRGNVGSGVVDDTLVSFSPGSSSILSQTDRLRVIAMNPALSAANVEANLARFDAKWITAMNWTTTDNLQQGLQSFNNGQNATFTSGIIKAFATGGVSHVSFVTNYTNLANPPSTQFAVINPQYTAQLQFGFEQPLWKDFGVGINQLLPRFPSINGNAGFAQQVAQGFNQHQGTVGGIAGLPFEGILVSKLRYDQSRAELERNLHALTLNAEVAYWRLYQAYGRLYSYEEVLRIAHRAWMVTDAKHRAGSISPAQYHPVRAQYEEFRGERTAALGAVLDAERNLRGILGLPMDDGYRLVPITPPTLAPYQPDWDTALRDALHLRPELEIARDNVRGHQYYLQIALNSLNPDLRMVGQYAPVGTGFTLTGQDTFIDGTGTPRPRNALQSLESTHFNNWTLGLTLNVPLGFRFEHASVRAARLNLIQAFYLLRDQEDRAKRALAQQYQKTSEWYRLIETRRAERLAYAESVKVRFSEYAAGKATVADFLLDSQRRLAAAQVKEYEAISEYNNALVRLEWAKGTILKFNNIHIAEGQLPPCAEVRAVEHERERTKAIVLRERPDPVGTPGRLIGREPTDILPIGTPSLPGESLDPLPAPGTLLPVSKSAPEQLPSLASNPFAPRDAAAPAQGPTMQTQTSTPGQPVLGQASIQSAASAPQSQSAMQTAVGRPR